ncbi:hypothetical protein PsYK624_057540 [Phanerochaete sordida]|uniref:Uncharacterized protein n=1 Tax=Phanerochaete sordida TaxID=48140 RepID=A0A9P3LCJ7_9APHY|nr:hypothetical protein PsYK624_057540 [Phanerochaete sordida]
MSEPSRKAPIALAYDGTGRVKGSGAISALPPNVSLREQQGQGNVNLTVLTNHRVRTRELACLQRGETAPSAAPGQHFKPRSTACRPSLSTARELTIAGIWYITMVAEVWRNRTRLRT